MRNLVSLAFLPLLVACTEQQMCISRETKDLHQIQSFIAEAEANIERGYAVTQEIVGVDHGLCRHLRCGVTGVKTRDVAVAIDLDAEASKLAVLKDKEARLLQQTDQAVAACKRQYPE